MSLVAKSKPKAYLRKRQAQHHRQSKPYLKTYWPYLPMLLIILGGLLLNSWLAKPQVLGAQTNFSTASLLSDTNANRLANGDDPLRINSELTQAASLKASDMVHSNYWAHNSPTGQTPWDFISSSGYQFQAAGENLAYGFKSATAVISAWMNSAEHRANILYPAYSDVGFGVAEAPNYLHQGPKTVVVAEYGQPTGTTSLADARLSAYNSAPVSRLQLLTDFKLSWLSLVLATLAGAALASLIIRYGLKLKRLAAQGEAFIIHHPMFDVGLVLLIVAVYVVTRTVGSIS